MERRAEHGLLRGEVDQIVGVDDQRAEAEFLAARAESGCVNLRNARWAAGPHARCWRKKLARALQPSLCAESSALLYPPAMEVWMPMRKLPSIQVGGTGSGSGSGGIRLPGRIR